MRNMPVFTRGQAMPAKMTAKRVLTFFNALNTAAAAKPAKVPFSNTVMTVPAGLMVRNAAASPEIKTVTPKAKPSHAPAPMPYIAAPMIIGARTRVMENGPNLMALATSWSTTTIAVNSPVPTIFLVFVFIFNFPFCYCS